MSPRAALLPALAAALVATVLGVQVAQGGGDFVPSTAADPCVAPLPPQLATGIEGLSEQLVLVGINAAACRLDVSREALVLRLAEQDGVTDAEVDAVRGGLVDAVGRLDSAGRLPQASEVADEALDDASLPGYVKSAIRALPDGLIDARFKTADVLRQAIGKLDVRRLLENLTDPDALNDEVKDAVTGAVRDILVDSIPNPFD